MRRRKPYNVNHVDPPTSLPGQAWLWARRWRWNEHNSLAWERLRIHWEFLRRSSFVRWPVSGNLLEALRQDRLEIGPHVHFEPHCWLVAPGDARIRIGRGTFLNFGVFVSSLELVEIGDHCMISNGSFVGDGMHSYDDPTVPVPWQPITSKGPTRVGANCWLGVNSVVTSGVTIGERCVIGANSVVTSDIPPFSVAAGVPAKVIRTITYESVGTRSPQTGVGAAGA